MAAGPISERNQGDWRGQTQNGLWGFGGPRSNVSAGAGDFTFPKGARLVPMPYGDGMDRLEACSCDAVS